MRFQVKFERYYTGMQVASLLCDSHLGRCLYYMEAAVLESGEVEEKDVVFEPGGGESNAGASSPLSLMFSAMVIMVEYEDTTAALGWGCTLGFRIFGPNLSSSQPSP